MIERNYAVDWYCALWTTTIAQSCLLQRLVRELVLIADMHFHQQRAVCRKSWQGLVSELLAAVGCVLLQAGTVRGQGGQAVVVNPSAVGDVDLSHILPPGRYFHQEFVVDLEQEQQRVKLDGIHVFQVINAPATFNHLILFRCISLFNHMTFIEPCQKINTLSFCILYFSRDLQQGIQDNITKR